MAGFFLPVLPFVAALLLMGILSLRYGVERRDWQIYACVALILLSAVSGWEGATDYRTHSWGFARLVCDASLLAGVLGSFICALAPPWKGLLWHKILFRAAGIVVCLSGAAQILIFTRIIACID